MQQSAVYLGGVHTSSVFLGKVVGFEVLIFSDKNRMRQKNVRITQITRFKGNDLKN